MPLMRSVESGAKIFSSGSVGFERARGIGVGAGFERVLALEFEQRGDFRQNFRDLILCHSASINRKRRG